MKRRVILLSMAGVVGTASPSAGQFFIDVGATVGGEPFYESIYDDQAGDQDPQPDRIVFGPLDLGGVRVAGRVTVDLDRDQGGTLRVSDFSISREAVGPGGEAEAQVFITRYPGEDYILQPATAWARIAGGFTDVATAGNVTVEMSAFHKEGMIAERLGPFRTPPAVFSASGPAVVFNQVGGFFMDLRFRLGDVGDAVALPQSAEIHVVVGAVPAVSAWGMVVMALLVLVVASVATRRARGNGAAV